MMKQYIHLFLLPLLMAAFQSCSDDTDEVATVLPPRIVSSLPADGAMDVSAENGELTLQIIYDRPVQITTDNPLQRIQILKNEATPIAISATGEVVSVTITGCEDGKNYEVYLPQGIVLAEDGTAAFAVRLSFTADVIPVITIPEQTITPDLSNPAATPEAVALYSYLVENYRTNILSGVMAVDAAAGYHSWNHEYADWVGNQAGKVPALNGFDYGHLTSSPANWIDYTDITPVSDWYQQGGIVSCMWHWNVPVTNPAEVADREGVLWTGEQYLGDNWENYVTLDGDNKNRVVEGSRLRICLSSVAAGAQLQVQIDWNGSYFPTIDLVEGATEATFEISAEQQALIQAAGSIAIKGKLCTVTQVSILTAGELTYGFYVPGGNQGTSETPFDAGRAITPGTWENQWILSDLEKLSAHLRLLSDAGIPVLWRPLHEASGAWFWWGAQGAETYKALWRMMYDYLVREQGLNNLIWIWTAEQEDDDWYPGDDCVDIIGRDIYDSAEAYELAAEYATLATRFPNKMIALTECGNVANVSDMWEAGAKWAWFMVWYPGSADGTSSGITWEQFAPLVWWNNAFSLDYVLTGR